LIVLGQIVFFLSLFLIVYTYILYPIVLLCIYAVVQVRRDLSYLMDRHNRRVPENNSGELPAVTLIIPAYNEADCLEVKIRNLAQIDYPAAKLDVILVSDGSTDGSNEILGAVQHPGIRTLILPDRMGKANALNVAISRARSEVLILSDASTLLAPDAVQKLVRHFSNPTVGAVCAALEFERTSESKHTEGIYWNYEGMLRLMESRLGATLTASGALYAVRRSAFKPLSTRTVIDDFAIPMNVRRLGFTVLYDPEAKAVEFAASSVGGEFTRRIRIAVGSFRALKSILGSRMDASTFFAFVSHKLLRWILPFLVIALLVSNAVVLSRSPLYLISFCGQLLFYGWACLGAIFHDRLKHVPGALLAYFLLAMNMAYLVGFARLFMRREEVTWKRVNQPNSVVGP
jgi:cellulose synthase/poly-beta-1,6-N-acetylglucosamine synthase-like glycosyltransferase